MALPTIVGVGAVASGAAAITPGLPTGTQENDILILVIETNNQAITVSGWTEAPGSPQLNATDNTRLTIFWKRATSSESAPTTSDSGDHQIGRIIGIRGCITTGPPFNFAFGSVDTNSNTTGSIPSPDGTLSKAFYTGLLHSVASQTNNPADLFFSSDGSKMYILSGNAGTNLIYQYSLSTAWDISTASYDSVSFNFGSQMTTGGIASIFFKADGTKLYISESQDPDIFQYTLSTPWDLSSATYDSKTYNTVNSETAAIFFSSDGTKLYRSRNDNVTIYQYSLSTAWDISTASYASVSYLANQSSGLTKIFFSPDGLKLYTRDVAIYQHSLSTPWDLSTASYDSQSYSNLLPGENLRSLYVNGSDFYILETTVTDAVYHVKVQNGTSVNDCMIVAACCTTRDGNSTAEFSSWANASLANVTERIDNVVNTGGGGGIGAATGEKATAGAVSNTTVTYANASRKGLWSAALMPPPSLATRRIFIT
jgi:hypothetical protein